MGTKEKRKCTVCNNEFETSRSDAKFCSAGCRKKYQRNPDAYLPTGIAITPVAEEVANAVESTLDKDGDRTSFPHYRKNNRTESGYWEDENDKPIIYTSNSWVDVPFNAVPVKKRGHPPMPDYMNGRQYYLWQLVDFSVNENNEAIIFDPTPFYKDFRYVMGGDMSRIWSNR